VKYVEDLSEIPKDRTLVDIYTIPHKNEYIILTLDENGNKYYYIMPFRFEFYYNTNGSDDPRHNPHLLNYKMLDKITIDDFNQYKYLVNKLKRDYENMIKIDKPREI